LILDEPTAGLDPNQIREVRALVRMLSESHTVLLSTHILSEVESTCSRALVINRGRLVAQGSLAELGAQRRSNAAHLSVKDPERRGPALLREIEAVKHVESIRPSADGVAHYEIAFAVGAGDAAELLERVVARLVGAGIGVREATLVKATLEEVFAELTRTELAERSAGPS
jgi:ABC-2 type transport system ATP-binding protein